MAEKNKTILEEALLDAKRIQEALQANTKEILRSVAREEIDGLVKESLNEEDFEEEDANTDLDTADAENDEIVDTDTEEVTSDTEETDLVPVTNDEVGAETQAPITDNPEVGGETGMDATALDLGNELDMTSASEDDVISVYKKLTGDDEIEVVGNDVHLTVSEPGEYVIKNAGAGKSATEEPITTELPVDDNTLDINGGDETEYEIALGGNEDENSDIESDLEPVGGEEEVSAEPEITNDTEEETEEEELDENSVRALNNGRNQSLKPNNFPNDKKGGRVDESKTNNSKLLKETTEKLNTLIKEKNNLVKENNEFRTSLKKFRNMLVETVLFNTNLTYVTKLFTEHTTTATEKKLILKRFDEEVSNLKESQKLYKTIKNELATKKPVVESIEKKINNEIQTSGSKQLNESTAYVDKDTLRIKDLINRVEKK